MESESSNYTGRCVFTVVKDEGGQGMANELVECSNATWEKKGTGRDTTMDVEFDQFRETCEEMHSIIRGGRNKFESTKSQLSEDNLQEKLSEISLSEQKFLDIRDKFRREGSLLAQVYKSSREIRVIGRSEKREGQKESRSVKRSPIQINRTVVQDKSTVLRMHNPFTQHHIKTGSLKRSPKRITGKKSTVTSGTQMDVEMTRGIGQMGNVKRKRSWSDLECGSLKQVKHCK